MNDSTNKFADALRLGAVLFVMLMMCIEPVQADRVKDLASVSGVRGNSLVGYGLVVGLDGTGDLTVQTPFTVQSLRNMLNQFGITIPDNVNPQLTNVAAVTIHAELPAFVKPGSKIDITVSSIGNAKSLRGGSLLVTPLRGVDGEVYALAQGNLVVGGFGATGNDGSSVTVNIPSAGRIPGGATVERSSPALLQQGEFLTLNLHSPDFTTASRLSTAINDLLGPGIARAEDAVSVRIAAPEGAGQRTQFLSILENIEVTPDASAARIVINSRTGTVVIGSHVRVSPAAVAHGSLVVTISEQPFASQPNALSRGGQTALLPDSEVSITEEDNRMFLFEPGTSLNDIVQAVNQVGAAPGDLVAILEALKQAGALRAELLVI